jgi:hypothetical protein
MDSWAQKGRDQTISGVQGEGLTIGVNGGAFFDFMSLHSKFKIPGEGLTEDILFEPLLQKQAQAGTLIPELWDYPKNTAQVGGAGDLGKV